MGDAQEPLFQIALLHLSVFVPPAAAVDHLLVGQHRGALRAPVHLALLAVDEAFLIHAQEKPLVPAVVLGQTRGDFGGPVVAQPKAQHLPLHGGDVAERPLARRHIVFERGVLGGQPEGVPPHGVQHVIAAHPHLPRQRVADRVVAHVSHVQLAAGIRQHLEHVVLGFIACRRFRGVELGVSGPSLLPLLFDCCRVVTQFSIVCHNLQV